MTELPINNIIQGDCLEVMKTFPDKSIDLIVTDPPYNTGMSADSSSARLKNFFNDSYSSEDYQKLVRGGGRTDVSPLKRRFSDLCIYELEETWNLER